MHDTGESAEMTEEISHLKYIVGGEVSELHFDKEKKQWLYPVPIYYNMLIFLDDKFEDSVSVSHSTSVQIECARHVISAIEQLVFANQPHNFILEVSPLKTREPKKGHFSRTHERPHYTLIHPQQARKVMRLPEPLVTETHKSPIPHERRKHERILRSDKFTFKKGMKIKVRATWVGPYENVVGNRKYKILLDK